ncbi:MAG: hypothetical protein A3F72_03820 [Bacteroidetes bacterium RIFCSPLOWO2_12_FULL_35_15]|nr:MAG: hypothetical protein A3F72_03820 [Bacteroidetes bacterium RIFCSPLOWO2_12_FULL_35_15]
MKEQFQKKSQKNKNLFSKTILTSLMITLGFILFSVSSYAQQVTDVAAPADDSSMGINEVIIFLLFCTIVLLAITVLLMVQTKNAILNSRKGDAEAGHSLFDMINASVSVEKEKDILMDHDYDGIKELDNNLPPWWKYGFYLTIVIAICYITYFHFLGGELQIARYEKSLVAAKAENEAYQKAHGDVINEDNVKLITDKAQLADAEKIFKTTCFVCHGAEGQGNAVGPNLTDDYWIHGGSIKDVFHSITSGWPEKGMQAWKSNFSALQISQISSYVKSLRGTNPPNPKEKQGDLYVEEGSGSVTVTKDSMSVPPKDSVKLGTK